MNCPECKEKLNITDTRKIKSDEGVEYIRRVRLCFCGYRFVTHEVPVELSKIPDIKRPYRNRIEYYRNYHLQCKAKKQRKKESWLERIQKQLETT